MVSAPLRPSMTASVFLREALALTTMETTIDALRFTAPSRRAYRPGMPQTMAPHSIPSVRILLKS
jgi:hypothetical protein